MSIAVVRCGSLLKLEWDACTPLSELRSLDACLGHSWTRACLSREMHAPGACKSRKRYARLSFVSSALFLRLNFCNALVCRVEFPMIGASLTWSVLAEI